MRGYKGRLSRLLCREVSWWPVQTRVQIRLPSSRETAVVITLRYFLLIYRIYEIRIIAAWRLLPGSARVLLEQRCAAVTRRAFDDAEEHCVEVASLSRGLYVASNLTSTVELLAIWNPSWLVPQTSLCRRPRPQQLLLLLLWWQWRIARRRLAIKYWWMCKLNKQGKIMERKRQKEDDAI